MSELNIRVPVLADGEAPAIRDGAAWATLHEVEPRPQPPYAPFFDDRHTPGDHLVAELAGEIVGHLRVVPATPLVCSAHVRQIQGPVVAAPARGAGSRQGHGLTDG